MIEICDRQDIPPGGARGFRAGGLRLLVVRSGDRVHVYENRCPHQGTTLDFKPDDFFDVDGRYLQCSTHGALFELDNGRCLAGPCVGAALARVAHVVDGDRILVRP